MMLKACPLRIDSAFCPETLPQCLKAMESSDPPRVPVYLWCCTPAHSDGSRQTPVVSQALCRPLLRFSHHQLYNGHHQESRTNMSSQSAISHEDRGEGVLATSIVVAVLAALTVALRFLTRIRIVRSVGWDDYTILCATIGEIIGTGLVIVEVHYGFGRHEADLTKWQYIEFMKYSYGEWIQTFQTLMFTKISICFFLLRIPVERYLLRPIQGAMIFLVVTNIVLTLLWIFQCNPIATAWNKDTPGHCFTDAQLQRIIMSQALISIISDFALALFPILLLWKVQIALRIKAGLCVLMGLGLM